MKAKLPFVSRNERLSIAICEYFYLTCVSILFFLPIFIPIVIISGIQNTVPQTWFILFMQSVIFIVFLNKDFWRGQSPVKRFYGYQVVDSKTRLPANKLKCFIRNLPILFPIVEVIPLLVSPKRRIGDFLARTVLIQISESDPESIIEDMRTSKWDSQTTIITIFSSILILAFAAYLIVFG
jgi:uncharacterized RDD family membrane protein YckC